MATDRHTIRPIAAVLVTGLVVLAPPAISADDAPLPPPPNAFIHTRIALAKLTPGDVVVTAKCEPGEQLLGGGYVSGDSLPHPFLVSVRANYPSAPDSWTVAYHNHADASATPNLTMSSQAYCLDAPGFPVDAVITEASNSGQVGAVQSVLTSCPEGSVLTGGGFAIEGDPRPTDPNQNTDLTSSMPEVGTDGVASGWRLGLAFLRPDLARPARAYAVCARKGIEALPAAVLARDLTQSPTAIGEHELAAPCGQGITTAGGSATVGDVLIPHPVVFTRTSNALDAWQVRLFGGWQTPNYVTRPCDPATQACLMGHVTASCYKPPDIPFIVARISSPFTGSHFDTDTSLKSRFGGPPKGGWKTQPITFKVDVTGKDGSPITDSKIFWKYTVAGQETTMKGGREFELRLPAGGAISFVTVSVTAWSGKLRASDQVEVTTGTVR